MNADRRKTAREYVMTSIEDGHRALNDIRDLLPSTGLLVAPGLTDELEAARAALNAIGDHVKAMVAQQDGGDPS